MKLATILPPQAPSFLEIARTASLLSSYQMFLGQWAVKDMRYRGEINRLHRRGDFIILDNGAAEPEAERVAFTDILTAALDLVDEIALPDELYDAETTLMLTEANAPLVPPQKRMIIPQGRTWETWTFCLLQMDAYLKGQYRTIGVPKHLERLEGGRAEAMRILVSTGLTLVHDIHMLGIWSNPCTEIHQVREVFPGIRGVDTGYPIAAAQANIGLNEGNWVHCSLLNDVDPNPHHYISNIQAVRRWCYDRIDA